MSGFLFNRHQSPEKVDQGPTKEELDRAVRAALDAQSITTSAIFALLVSKGILSAGEAAAYMQEIGAALRRDVAAPLGETAGDVLDAYGDALVRAGG